MFKSTEIIRGGKDNQLAFTGYGFGSLSVGWYRRYVQQEDAIALVRRAYDKGVRVFDTSTLYGALRAEWILGAALEGIDRSTYTLSSKSGYDVTGYAPDFVIAPNVIPRNYSYDFTMRSVEGSLKRLKTDYLDIVHIHDTEPQDDFKEVLNGAYKALAELKEQGVIRGIGFGNKFISELKRASAADVDFDACLCACRYSILDHKDWLDEIQDIVVEKNIAVMDGGCFTSGIAADAYEPVPLWDYMPASFDQIKKAQDIDKICHKYGGTLRQAALQFPTFNPAVKCVVVGTGSIEHLDEDMHDFDATLPVELWKELKELGYIDERAMIPEE